MLVAGEYGLVVKEDCCQARTGRYEGRHAGSKDDFGCFSFQQTRQLTARDVGTVIVRADSRFLAEIAGSTPAPAPEACEYRSFAYRFRLDLGMFDANLDTIIKCICAVGLYIVHGYLPKPLYR